MLNLSRLLKRERVFLSMRKARLSDLAEALGSKTKDDTLDGVILLRRWIMHELDALLNAALKAREASCEELLFVFVYMGKRIGGLFCSGWLGIISPSYDLNSHRNVRQALPVQRSSQCQLP